MINPITFYDNFINPITFIEELYVNLNCLDIDKNLYQISTFGNIRRKIDNKMINSHLTNSGYLQVSLKTLNGNFKWYLVHRLVATMFVYRPDNKNIVNHLYCNPLNNYYENLEWCTQKENIAYATKLGNFNVIGEDNVTSRLTNEQVHSICYRLQNNIQYKDILIYCGLEVNKENLDLITKIRTGKLWKHISCLYNIPKSNSRSIQNVYTNEQIHSICKYIELGLTNRQICEKMNIDISNKKLIDKFWHFISRIRKRVSYVDISKNYNW